MFLDARGGDSAVPLVRSDQVVFSRRKREPGWGKNSRKWRGSGAGNEVLGDSDHLFGKRWAKTS